MFIWNDFGKWFIYKVWLIEELIKILSFDWNWTFFLLSLYLLKDQFVPSNCLIEVLSVIKGGIDFELIVFRLYKGSATLKEQNTNHLQLK